jgi:23S rRNA-/tRNA-specific pseudouridylate synthase
MLIAFQKPYGVLSRFTPDGSPNRTLAEFAFPKNVYPIGRLDADSEGLLLLSDEAALNERLLHPRHAHEREYWVQVERIPHSGSPDQAGQRTGHSRTPHPALPRLAARPAAGAAPARPAHPLPQDGADQLDWHWSWPKARTAKSAA